MNESPASKDGAPTACNRLSSLLFQKLLYLKRRHASRPRRRDRLPVPPVLHVAARVDTRHARENIIARLDISVLVRVEQSLEHPRVRNVPDPQEHRARRMVPYLTRLDVPQL